MARTSNGPKAVWALRSFALALVFVAATFVGTVFAETWQFGNQRLIRNSELPVRNLQVSPGGRGALTSFRYVGRVGGIAFEAVAEFSEDVDLSAASLVYRAQQSGNRAALVYKGQTYQIPLHDWQLKPIAAFANSAYTAVVSLFGEGPDRLQNFYIEYHRAFRDTLLGLRLLQADLILIDVENLTDLPRNSAGAQILGSGERAVDRDSTGVRRSQIEDLVRALAPQSWVLTDVGRSARVGLVAGRVEVDLQPYYYFWRSGSLLPSTRELTVIPVDEVPADRLLKDINPAVYEAVINTARYAALFRAYKSRNPEGWRNFMNALPTTVVPAVDTPNQWKH